MRDRKAGADGQKARFVKDSAHIADLEEMIRSVKPTVLIGACGVGGVFTEGILRGMAQWNDKPVIFALSNPTANAECTAEQAYTYTDVSG